MLWLSVSGAFREKITSSNWWEIGDGSVPLGILWCFGEWVVMMFLVWYLENTLSVGYGVSKHPCFCFQRRYWAEVRGKLDLEHEDAPQEIRKEKRLRPDIAAEQDRVFDLDGQKNPPVVRVLRLEKEFKRGKGTFKAVNGVSFGINSNECFGLLGHNGAGKTTTINILSGLFKPTGGNAFVKQFSIKTDIDTIHSHMGVCNQHDILWGDLSAVEHLMFYGRLKNLQGKELDKAVAAALESVKLSKFGHRQAKAYSGGMKRRLSVACALIGSPLVTYLDEPSTGLDPASRHNLWDVIIASKGKRSLILTTHSMEEADVLCDRIGIMDFGRLQCVGTSPELKQRFGAGYTMMVTSSDRSQGSMKALLAFLTKNWPSATLLNEPIAGSMKLEIFANEVKLSSCFRIMEANRDELKITDWGITETTLEEVFLKVTSEGFLTRDRAATNSILMGDQPPPVVPEPQSESPKTDKRITVT
jgi:ABC-type multidrug transport system ATPase subunit